DNHPQPDPQGVQTGARGCNRLCNRHPLLNTRPSPSACKVAPFLRGEPAAWPRARPAMAGLPRPRPPDRSRDSAQVVLGAPPDCGWTPSSAAASGPPQPPALSTLRPWPTPARVAPSSPPISLVTCLTASTVSTTACLTARPELSASRAFISFRTTA